MREPIPPLGLEWRRMRSANTPFAKLTELETDRVVSIGFDIKLVPKWTRNIGTAL